MRSPTTKRSHHLYTFLLLFCILPANYALKCRSEDGPSDAELKRVARACMHKVSESSYKKNGYSSSTGLATGYTSTNTNYYGQQNYGQNSNGKKYGSSYDDDDVIESRNYRGNSYERGYNNDMLRQRNRERMQNFSELFGRSNSSNSGRSSSGSNSSSNGGNNNQRSSSRNSGSNGSNNNNNSNNSNNNSSHDRDHQSDGACVVHCFFEEMNMLNSDDYPDKHKVSYLLTKDLHDRELRAFYTETIQDCFNYLQSQRRREKCQFSRDLISCMTEYAKANCEDWEDHNIMFN